MPGDLCTNLRFHLIITLIVSRLTWHLGQGESVGNRSHSHSDALATRSTWPPVSLIKNQIVFMINKYVELKTGNACYHLIQTLFLFLNYMRDLKLKYRNYIITCCAVWLWNEISYVKEGTRLNIFENNIVSLIFELRDGGWQVNTSQWGISHFIPFTCYSQAH